MEFKGTQGKLPNKETDEEQDNTICGTWLSGIEENEMARKYYAELDEKYKLEECKANVLLISKAPEMLEMLKSIADQLADGQTPELYKIDELIKEATELP